MRARYYALKLYANTGFPKFYDSYKTLKQAQQVAKNAISEGFYHTVEIFKDLPQKPGYFGIEREVVETVGRG